MVQRASGYARQPLDLYSTPSWVTQALLKVEKFDGPIWEPACGDGAMVDVLEAEGHEVYDTDVALDGTNFLQTTSVLGKHIITNPPFSLAEPFVRHALKLTQPMIGAKVAMLLPTYFDNAKTRIGLFKNPPFKIKYVLTNRIRWPNLMQKANGPSTNHAWYVWQWGNNEEPKIWWI